MQSRTELLEEEQLLLKERGNLKDKLAYMHLTVEKQRANNAGLKKIKLNLVSESENNKNKALTSLVVSGKSKPFLLPDLNLPPEEEHYDNLRLR
ncbi:DNA-directed RNA polymerase [Trifolium pratense]|uniref:DNA-directed RNA polymerase n=1 Tax=Trifolium pratense TaxID=57577 RepID=A0A2K3MK21_TRIPR|nr:DNA-directed RNA polymerase [Trifolium pratense]PNX91095.1 DNA-directed RNA polymerase [Trifolium pratense]